MSQRRSLFGAALLLQRCNLLVSCGSQEVVLLVELGQVLSRLFCQRGKVSHHGLDRSPGGFAHCHDGLPSAIQLANGHTASAHQFCQHISGLALRSHVLRDTRSHLRQLVSRGTSRIARQDQLLVELGGLGCALEVRDSQCSTRSGSQRERVHQASDVTSQGAGRIAHTSKCVPELATLLQQHRQRRLTRGQARHDVRQLHGQHAHVVGHLASRHAHHVDAVGHAADVGLGLLRTVQRDLDSDVGSSAHAVLSSRHRWP